MRGVAFFRGRLGEREIIGVRGKETGVKKKPFTGCIQLRQRKKNLKNRGLFGGRGRVPEENS